MIINVVDQWHLQKVKEHKPLINTQKNLNSEGDFERVSDRNRIKKTRQFNETNYFN